MRAGVLRAEWAPKAEAALLPEQEQIKWAANASLAYRNPTFGFETVPDPEGPAADEVIVAVAACGICGSDLHMVETDDDGYMLLPYHMRTPVVTGHELSGKVVAVGTEVTELADGDLVTAEEMQWCGVCTECRGGYWNQCRNLEDLGFTVNGGFAEFVKLKAKYCWKLNELVERYGSEEAALEVGAMSEPCSVVYEGMFTRAGGFRPGGAVAVFGAGPIGLAAVALASAAGASQVHCIETIPERRELAARIGATHVVDPAAEDAVAVVEEATRGDGVAMVVECTGNFPAVVRPAEQMLGVGGKLNVLGMDGRPASVSFIDMQVGAHTISGGIGHAGSWNFSNVHKLMASGKLSMEAAITGRLGLEHLPAALRDPDRAGGKVLVKPSL